MSSMTLLLFLVALVGLSSSTYHPPYWEQIVQHGPLPVPISDAAGTFVEDFGFFLFGGLNGSAGDLTDEAINAFYLFNPDTTTWEDLSGYSNGPAPRAEAMIWPTDSGVVVSGGRGPFRRNKDLTFNDTFQFVYDGGWVKIGQGSSYANRSSEAAVTYKKGSYVAYAFSGSSSTLPRFVNRWGALRVNTVAFTPSKGWESVVLKHNSPVPTPRVHHCLIASPNGKSLFTYGGYTADATGADQIFGEANYLGDLWEFKTVAKKWVRHNFSGANPGKRDNGKLFYDEARDRLWLVGGSTWEGGVMDLWFYDFASAGWTNVTSYLVGGVQPPVRQGPVFFDRVLEDRFEFWLFGGSSGELLPPLNDLWRLTVPLDFVI